MYGYDELQIGKEEYDEKIKIILWKL